MTGKIAVAQVIQNRLEDGRWGDTHNKVILSPKQFSIFNSVKNQNKLRNPLKYDTEIAWRESFEAAQKVLAGKVEDLTEGSMWYIADYIKEPKWVKNLEFVKQIGRHKFYREKVPS